MALYASRDTDVRVALALGWQWQRLPNGLQLLTPPEGSYVYDEADGGLQLVPAYSTDIHVWEEYVTELPGRRRLLVQVTGKGAWVFKDDRPFVGPTVCLTLCKMVLQGEERRAA